MTNAPDPMAQRRGSAVAAVEAEHEAGVRLPRPRPKPSPHGGFHDGPLVRGRGGAGRGDRSRRSGGINAGWSSAATPLRAAQSRIAGISFAFRRWNAMIAVTGTAASRARRATAAARRGAWRCRSPRGDGLARPACATRRTVRSSSGSPFVMRSRVMPQAPAFSKDLPQVRAEERLAAADDELRRAELGGPADGLDDPGRLQLDRGVAEVAGGVEAERAVPRAAARGDKKGGAHRASEGRGERCAEGGRLFLEYGVARERAFLHRAGGQERATVPRRTRRRSGRCPRRS